MGYVRERKVLNISFDDGHEFAGLHMRTRSLSTGALLEVIELATLTAKKADDLTAEDLSGIGRLFDRFAEALISWDLEEEAEDEGAPPAPVPPTADGVKSQDLEFMLQLVGEWIGQVAGVSPELGKDSPSGVTFPEGSPVTETQLASLSSSLTPG